METSRMTVKGQVTIPKSLRERFGLRPGDEVEFVEQAGRIQLQKLVRMSPFARYRGYLRHLANRNPDQLVEELRGKAES